MGERDAIVRDGSGGSRLAGRKMWMRNIDQKPNHGQHDLYFIHSTLLDYFAFARAWR